MSHATQIADLCAGALCLWREARGQPREGLAAVAWTFVRRSKVSGWWNGHDAGSIAAVVEQRLQYSSMTDVHDLQLTRFPRGDEPDWALCLEVFENVVAGIEPDAAPGADSYYATSMTTPPSWATPDKFVAEIGQHRFYRLLT